VLQVAVSLGHENYDDDTQYNQYDGHDTEGIRGSPVSPSALLVSAMIVVTTSHWKMEHSENQIHTNDVIIYYCYYD
jgi:hypothetical protein